MNENVIFPSEIGEVQEAKRRTGENPNTKIDESRKSIIEDEQLEEIYHIIEVESIDERFQQCKRDIKKQRQKLAKMEDLSKMVELNLMEAQQMKELCAAEPMEREWKLVTVVVESGASEPVTDMQTFPGVPIHESQGQRDGLGYLGITGQALENIGEQYIEALTECWSVCNMTWQVTEAARRPLLAT